jgi:hypothetical protein
MNAAQHLAPRFFVALSASCIQLQIASLALIATSRLSRRLKFSIFTPRGELEYL